MQHYKQYCGLEPWQTGEERQTRDTELHHYSGLLCSFSQVWTAVWDSELCLWPDETRPLSTYLWISRSRDSVSTTCLHPADRPLSPLKKKKKVNIFYCRIRRLGVVYRLLAPKFNLLLNLAKKAEWHEATGASLPRKETGSDCAQPGLIFLINTDHKPSSGYWHRLLLQSVYYLTT